MDQKERMSYMRSRDLPDFSYNRTRIQCIGISSSTWLDFWDFLVSNNILPLGAMIIALFCTSKRFGWGFDNLMAEANKGKGLKIKPWMKPIFGVVVPVCILAIYIIGMVTFEWR